MTEALARLTPKTQNWDNIPGGVTELSNAEFAGYLAGLSRAPYLMALACWTGNEDVLSELERLALAEASKHFEPRQVLRPGFLRSLCDIAITQAVEPPKCDVCQGRGEIWRQRGAVVDCEACKRTGNGKVGGERVRRIMGVSESVWRSIEPSFQNLEREIWGWKSQAAGHIAQKLSTEQAHS